MLWQDLRVDHPEDGDDFYFDSYPLESVSSASDIPDQLSQTTERDLILVSFQTFLTLTSLSRLLFVI